MVQRLSWLLGSQSFLFTAYAIVANGLASGGRNDGTMLALFWMLPAVGVLTSALIWTGIFAAKAAMERLMGEFEARNPDVSALGMPPLRTPAGIRSAGLAAPTILPAIFILAWFGLLVASAV